MHILAGSSYPMLGFATDRHFEDLIRRSRSQGSKYQGKKSCSSVFPELGFGGNYVETSVVYPWKSEHTSSPSS